MLKRNITLLLAPILLAGTSFTAGAQRMNAAQRQKALTEVRNFKHKILTQELDLTKDQQTKFFDINDQMDEELFDVAEETRALARKVSAAAGATATARAAAARALFEQRKREGAIDMKYYDKLADGLTPTQLLKLKPAERKIAMRMARYHGHPRGQRQAEK